MTAPFPSISLIPLTDAEYAPFAEQSVVEPARQHAMSGEWTQAEAMGRAREEEAELLAGRLRGGGHYFFQGGGVTAAGLVWGAGAGAGGGGGVAGGSAAGGGALFFSRRWITSGGAWGGSGCRRGRSFWA